LHGRKTICVTAVDPKRRRLTPRFISAVPRASLMRAGNHFDGEIFDATYTSHKTFGEREGPMWNGVRDEREECSLTLETPRVLARKRFTGSESLAGRQMPSEGTRALSSFATNKPSSLI